jgi:type VI secretion system protein ImpE
MGTTAQELFDAARLSDAIKVQTEAVRAYPSRPEERSVLFALLCFAGDLERASRQLEALGLGQGPTVEMRTSVYRSLLAAETERREVWAGRGKPLLALDAPPTLEKRLAALSRWRAGDLAGATRLLDAAAADAVEVSGRLNGRPFEQLRDTDDFGASVLEVYAQGRCLWLSFEQVRRLEIPEPEGLLDLVFPPARLLDRRGNEAMVFLPALYAGSHEQSDDRLRLGRMTEWVEVPGLGGRGVGQKVLLAVHGESDEECGLLDVRTLEVDG